MPATTPDPAPVVVAQTPADKAATKAHHALAKRQTRPWWASLLPDQRGWAALGFFGLAVYLLRMIEANPRLLANASFMQFAGMLMTGGVLLVGNYLFGGSKVSTDTSTKGAQPPPTPPTAG